jgi:hypothetical protein
LRYADFGQKPCRYTDFLKKINNYITKRGFELHGFFLEPKTAHLEALLYFLIAADIDTFDPNSLHILEMPAPLVYTNMTTVISKHFGTSIFMVSFA